MKPDDAEGSWSELLLDGQRRVLKMVATGAALGESLEALVRLIEQQAPGMLGSILLLDESGKYLRHGAAPSLPAEYVKIIDGKEIGPKAGSCGTAAYRKQAVIAEDIATDPRWVDYREYALPYGLRACWSTPIFDSQRRVHGTFAMYYREPALPEPRHLQLIDLTTHIASIAICHDRAAAELRQSEARLKEAERIANIGYWERDLAADRITWSEQTWRIFGLAPREAPLSQAELAERIHPDDRQLQKDALAAVMQDDGNYDVEYRIVRPSGEVRYVHMRDGIVRDPSGRPVRTFGTVQDITERRRLEEQLRQSQKMEAIGQLAGGIAHDFNNMLSVVQMSTSLLLHAADNLSPMVKASLEDIMAATERAANLTRQLLMFSRREVTKARDVNLCEVVESMAKMLRRILGTDIMLETQTPAGVPAVRADPGLVEQVIMNLAVNSRDAMPAGGQLKIALDTVEIPAPRVTPNRRPSPGRFVRLSVRDTGSGIPPEVQSRIFEPFFTTKEAGKGTGLGLATVFGIVEQHGGWIEVESEVGKGTGVLVYWPAREAGEMAKTE
ncbi:MAG TPA: ATP-binding protein [Chthoniobacteraceae bacterium]|jgi:PAS domain S-box-containing protein|nr:ATP-binding protein [Chthoniobacteraceae bacterium]